jgi:hypothetical protein
MVWIRNSKKGELTSKQLITIIILIVSFSIILLFFFMFDFWRIIDEESCRNSVAMRGAMFGPLKKAVSLRCETQEVCLSMGGDCGGNGEKISIANEGELVKEMAGLIRNCWWMFGNGKIEYGSGDYCAICYDVYFDDKIKGETWAKGGLKYHKIYDYLASFEMDDGENSLFSLYAMNSVNEVRNFISQKHKIDILNDVISFSENYVVVDSWNGGKYRPPIFVDFKGSELSSKLECGRYVTEA